MCVTAGTLALACDVGAGQDVRVTGGRDIATTHPVLSGSSIDEPKLDIIGSAELTSCDTGTLRPFDQAPVNGQPIAIASSGATVLEAENFNCGGEGVGYHDNTAGNQSTSSYRSPASVDVMDMTASGRTVQFFDTGEWMTYTINVVAAGSYTLAISAASNQVAAGQVAGQFRIDVDGTAATGNVNVLSTGSWDTYAWTSAPSSVALAAGQHVLKLVSVQQSYRVDQLRMTASPVGTQSLFHSFETSMTEGGSASGGYDLQAAAPDRLTWETQITRDGSKAVRLTTNGSDTNVSGSGEWERAELAMDTSHTGGAENVEQWWANSVYFPDNFQMPPAGLASWPQSVFMQFHSNPNYGAAPFGMEITREGSQAPYPVMRVQSHGGTPCPDDANACTQYTHLVGGTPITGEVIVNDPQRNVWYDFVHHVLWKSDGTGFHKIWMRAGNGAVVQVLNKTGISTLYPNTQIYLKIGTYHSRLDNPPPPGSVIHDRIVRGTSFEAVAPPGFACPQGTGQCN